MHVRFIGGKDAFHKKLSKKKSPNPLIWDGLECFQNNSHGECFPGFWQKTIVIDWTQCPAANVS